MSTHLFPFKRGDYVVIIVGTYLKPYPVRGTVIKDVPHRHSMVPVQFDDPQIGNTLAQKLRGPQIQARVSKKYVTIEDPPRAEAQPADDDAPATRVTQDDVSTVSSDGVLHHLDSLDLEDARISNELRLRIRDLCECFKREGLHRNSPSIPALLAMGLSEVRNWDD